MAKLGCVPSVYTFNSLISGLCKAGQLQDATSMFNKMKIKPLLFLRLSQGINSRVKDTDSLRKMVEELCEARFLVKAYKLLHGIIDVVVPYVVTYNVLINELFKCGKPEEALKLFKELQIMGQSPDEVTLATLIDGLSKVHSEEDAWMVYQYLLKNRCSLSLSICSTVMRMLCRKKEVSQAVNLWFTHIPQRSTCEKEAETIKATMNHFEQGNLEESVKRLIEMDRELGSVSSSYTICLIGFWQAWQADEALKISNILKEFDVEVTPPSCVLLVHSLCWEGMLAAALDDMLYALRKGFSLGQPVGQPVGNCLLMKLCMDDKKKEAHELVWRSSLAGYDMDAYLRVSTKHSYIIKRLPKAECLFCTDVGKVSSSLELIIQHRSSSSRVPIFVASQCHNLFDQFFCGSAHSPFIILQRIGFGHRSELQYVYFLSSHYDFMYFQ